MMKLSTQIQIYTHDNTRDAPFLMRKASSMKEKGVTSHYKKHILIMMMNALFLIDETETKTTIPIYSDSTKEL